MRNDRFVFIALVLVSSFLILFYFWGMQKEFRAASNQKKAGEEQVDKLQSQLKQLAQLQDSARKAGTALQDELKKEKERTANLEEELKMSVGQGRALAVKLSRSQADQKRVAGLQQRLEELELNNQALKKSFEEAKRKFELIDPLREKISGVESALDALELKKGKEELLSVQLDSISKELNGINNYLLQLLENNVSPIRDYAQLSGKTPPQAEGLSPSEAVKYRAQFEKLKADLDQAEKEKETLKEQNEQSQEQLAQGHKELNARAEKIFSLQEKVMTMENSLFEMQSNFKELEKDAAVLREKYVAVELEKSSLQIALDQTRQELAQLQGKFLSLLGRLGGIFKSGEEAQALKNPGSGGAKNNTKIDVELLPQQPKE